MEEGIVVLKTVYVVAVENVRQRSSGGIKENGWECLRLKYSADWPLHVLFTTPVLDRCQQFFCTKTDVSVLFYGTLLIDR